MCDIEKIYYFDFFIEQMPSKEDVVILIGKLFKLTYKKLDIKFAKEIIICYNNIYVVFLATFNLFSLISDGVAPYTF